MKTYNIWTWVVLLMGLTSLWGMPAVLEKDSLSYASYFKNRAALLCDGCGCSVNGGSMGTGTLLQSDFVGLRTLYQRFESREGVFHDAPTVQENMQTLQIWGRIPIYKRFELFVQVPYQYLQRTLSTGTDYRQGLGDISVMGLYRLYKTVNDTLAFQHRVQIGVGVKCPTGTYDAVTAGTQNPSFQLGTGSWDYSFSTEYTLGYHQTGLLMLANYVYKTQNSKGYQFGNQYSVGGTLFHLLRSGRHKWVPQTGVVGEWYQSNAILGYTIDQTEGRLLLFKYGLEWSYARWGAGFNGFSPISQHLAGGEVQLQWRGMLHLNFRI